MTTFGDQVYSASGLLSPSQIPATFGNTYFVDVTTGSDGFDGLSMVNSGGSGPKATVQGAYDQTTNNNNDVIVLSAVGAHSVAAQIDWTNSRTHLVGLDAGGRYIGQRARLEMGVTTGSGIAIIRNTGNGNTFTNIKFRSTDTLSTSLYAFADGGEHTILRNCALEKATDLNQTGAAELLANGDTCYYDHCSFGNLIYEVSVARQNVLCTRVTISGKVARDCIWEDCFFLGKTSSTTFVNVRATGNDLERLMIFKNCSFVSAKTSSATQALSFGIASDLTDAEILLQGSYQINITDVAASSRGVFTTAAVPSVEGTEAIEVT